MTEVLICGNSLFLPTLLRAEHSAPVLRVLLEERLDSKYIRNPTAIQCCCIQQVAAVIKSMEEFGAFTARYGGDEFVLIYEGATKEDVIRYTAELRRRVMNLQIEHRRSKESNIVTISQGVCWDIPAHGNRMWDYLHSADEMLYRVKQRKRNNFCIGNLTEAADQIIMSYL